MVLFDEDFRRTLEQTCWLCRQPENVDLRRQWGCHEDAAEPWIELECWNCRDQPPEARPLCWICEGRLRVPVHRCPHSMMGTAEVFACEASTLLEAGLLPFQARGWSSLPATLMRAIGIVSQERARIRDRMMARNAD